MTSFNSSQPRSDVSNQLISLASREKVVVRAAPSTSKWIMVSNQLISLASRELLYVRFPLLLFQVSNQLISLASRER